MSLYSLYLAAGDVGGTHYATSPDFTDFTPGQPLYLSFKLKAIRQSGVDTITIYDEVTWFDAAGTNVGTTSHNRTVDTTGEIFVQNAHLAPASARKGHLRFAVVVSSGTMEHDLWISNVRLGKTELHATNGATWGTNILSTPANLAALSGSEGINNNLVSIGANGALVGGGGGQVTITGLGYTGSLNAGTSGLLTPIGTGTVIKGNSTQKQTGTHGAYEGGAVGTAQMGTAFIQSSFFNLGGGWLQGLALDDDATTFGSDQKYMVQFISNSIGDGYLYLYSGGSLIGNSGLVSVTDASRMAVAYDGEKVYAILDGVSYVSVKADANLRLWPKVIDYYKGSNSGIWTNDILYGSFGQNAVVSNGERIFGFQNMLDMRDWKAGANATDPNFQFRDANSSTGESALVNGTGPFGTPEVIWKNVSSLASGVWDGGWNNARFDATDGFDPTKKNIYFVWVKREPGNLHSYFYFGCEDTVAGSEKVENLNGVANPNPYFAPGCYPDGSASNNVEALNGKWYLWVGVVHEAGYTGGDSGLAGCYDPVTGQKLNSFTEYRYKAGVTGCSHRIFAYPGAAAGDISYFARPAVLRFEGTFSISNYLGTPGATWGSNLSGRPSNLAALVGSEGIQNVLVSIGNNGALTGGGGGQVTISGLGYNGDLTATVGDNLIANADILNDTSQWQLDAGVTRVTATAAGDPGYYFRGTVTNANARPNNFAQQACAPDSDYYFDFWVRSNASLAQVVMQVDYWDASGALIDQKFIYGQVTAANTWQHFTDLKHTNANAVKMRLAAFTFGMLNGATTLDLAKPRMSRLQAGATNGATWGTNVSGRPANLSGLVGTENINNASISIGSNGALTGGGGGQVTWNGLGAQGYVMNAAHNGIYNAAFRVRNSAGAPIGWSYNTSQWSPSAEGLDAAAYLASGTDGTTTVTSDPIPVFAGNQYTVQGELFSAGMTSGTVEMDVQWYQDAAGTTPTATGADGAGIALAAGNGWTKLYQPTTAPAGAQSARIRMFCANAVHTGGGLHAVRKPKFAMTGVETLFTDDRTYSHRVLTQPGHRVRLADPRNMPPVAAAGGRYYFNQNPSYSATTTSATISIAAGSLRVGSNTVSYNAMSVVVSGTAGTTATYNLYIDDSAYNGGSQTLVATTSTFVPYENDARIYLGQVSVTFPASGTTTGDGTGGGGGGYSCVWEDSWVETSDGFVRARDIQVGDELVVLDYDTMESLRLEPVTANKLAAADGWEITAANGTVLWLAAETPLTLRDGTVILPCELAGHELPIKIGDEFEWMPCYAQPLGRKITVAHISCGCQTYAAGNELGRSILTHNPVSYAKP